MHVLCLKSPSHTCTLYANNSRTMHSSPPEVFPTTQLDENCSFWINQRTWHWVLLPDAAFATLRIFQEPICFWILSGLGYRGLNQINLFFSCFGFPKTGQCHISLRMTELRSRDVYVFRFKLWQSSGTCDTANIFDNKSQ